MHDMNIQSSPCLIFELMLDMNIQSSPCLIFILFCSCILFEILWHFSVNIFYFFLLKYVIKTCKL